MVRTKMLGGLETIWKLRILPNHVPMGDIFLYPKINPRLTLRQKLCHRTEGILKNSTWNASLDPWLLFLYWHAQSVWFQHSCLLVMDNRISLDFLLVCQDRMCENINESSHGWINDSGQMKKSIQKLKERENWVCKLYSGGLWGLLGWLDLRLWGLWLILY